MMLKLTHLHFVFIKALDGESLQTVFNVIRAWVKNSLDNIEYSMVNQVN